MTSHYISSLSNIKARNLGPLTSNKAPNVTRVTNFGIVNGTPPQYFSQQEPINSNMHIISRIQHLRTQSDTNAKQVYRNTSASERIRQLKTQAIGNNMKTTSTKNVNQNDVRSAVRRMRSSGYVVPRKKTRI